MMFDHSSVAKPCPALCNPVKCSTPGFPVLHCLPEFAQTHVHWEKSMAPHSSIHAWEIPWTEEPGGLQSIGLQELDTTERLNWTECKELTHWKRPWCWERLKAKGEGSGRGWDGQIARKGHEFEQTLGDSEGQGSLSCCSSWGHKELDTT